MPIFSWSIVLLAFIGNLILGLLTYFKNPKSSTNKWFALFSFLFASYLVCNQLSIVQGTDAMTLLWIRIVMAIAPLIVYSFFILVSVFPRQKFTLSTPIFTAISVLALAITLLGLTPFEFTGVKSGTNQPIPGPGIVFFVLYNFVMLGISMFILVKKLRSSVSREKIQLSFFLYGALAMFSLILLTNVVFVVFLNISSLVVLVPIYTLIFNGSVSYAIVKHRLLDINILVARTVTYSLLITIIAIAFVLLVFIPSQLWFGYYFSIREQVAFVVITVLTTLMFQWVRKGIEKVTSRIFFKNKYDPTKLLYDLALIMASTLRLEDLAHEVLQTLMEEVNITKAGFIILSDGSVVDVKTEGFEETPVLDENEIRKISATRSMMLFDDLEEGELKEILRRLGWSVVVHLRTEGKQIGLLVLGSKKSGDMYNETDINLMDILAPEIAVAIQNSQAYEEIRRFNITLQEEVDKATEDLKQANTKLQQLDKLKDEFVSLASHELRTPLTAIRSYVWMAISGKGGVIPDKEKYYLDRAFTSTNRLIKLVNDMLNISRIESGRVSVQLTRANIHTLIDEVVSEVKPKIEEQGLTLILPTPDDTPEVIADIDKIKEVLINFIGNSIKFTPRGGTVTVKLSHDATMVTIAVVDNGIGMNPEDLGKLFKKFGTLQPFTGANNQVFQSTGLGLYISKSIVAMHGGTVNASSEGQGRGSTFTFTLPIYSEAKRESLQNLYKSEGVGIIHSVVS